MVWLVRIVVVLLADVFRLVPLLRCSSAAIRAENLVLRKQLAQCIERGIQPRRVDSVTRISLALLTRLFVVGEASAHRYLIHDRDNIFATRFDNSVRALGLKVLRTPFRSPKANSICERVIGTVRREFLDWIIPVSETHLRATLREWVTHYNAGRPHKMLGPGVPSPPALASVVPQSEARHRLPARTLVHAKSVLGGLHHEYSFAAAVA